LLQTKPEGPTRPKSTDTCWGHTNRKEQVLSEFEDIIADRRKNASSETSYIAPILKKGINKIAQKIGKEAI
jgi:phosphoribosyl-ATP pyrophosphohydrolase/phosphoribosyl-AMP cyclohydrolase